MTNEEKIKEIYYEYAEDIEIGNFNSDTLKLICESMIEYKDQKFREYLEKKRMRYAAALTQFDVMRVELLDEIINELFE